MAKTMAPEKMTALLLKLRKGADASLTMGQLFQVLDHLGGWRHERMVGLVAMSGDSEKPEQLDTMGDEDEAKARAEYAAAKALEVDALPEESERVIGRSYYMGITPFASWDIYAGLRETTECKLTKMLHGAHFKLWIAREGYRFTAPNGLVFELLPGRYDRRHEIKRLSVYDVVRWLKKETSYIDQVCEKLGMEPHEPAQPRCQDHTGTCSHCFRNIKLVNHDQPMAGMALHGFERPHHAGYTVGRCGGMTFPPFELSPAGTIVYRDSLIASRTHWQARADAYRAGTIASIIDSEQKTHTLETDGPDRWARRVASAIDNAERMVLGLDFEIKRYTGRIDRWVELPLPKEGDLARNWDRVPKAGAPGAAA